MIGEEKGGKKLLIYFLSRGGEEKGERKTVVVVIRQGKGGKIRSEFGCCNREGGRGRSGRKCYLGRKGA